MREIIIKYNPFLFSQTVFIRDDMSKMVTNYSVKTPDLNRFVSEVGKKKDVKAIHLFGNEKMVNKMKTECATQYDVNPAKFYINC